jgi:hypothetical protein
MCNKGKGGKKENKKETDIYNPERAAKTVTVNDSKNEEEFCQKSSKSNLPLKSHTHTRMHVSVTYIHM